MKPNGRRAWRKAAKKLRRTMGRRWRSQEEWVYGKRWSELVPDLEAHRAHVTGAWFKRHGVTEQGLQKLDAPHLVRVYVGLWGTADGDFVTYAVKPQLFTARSLVGMSEAAKKRAVRAELEPKWWFGIKHGVSAHAVGEYARDVETVRAMYRIGERLRPCPGCCSCGPCFGPKPCRRVCDGSGVLPAKSTKAKRPE